ncbi:hypothetical protein QA860_25505 [Streptomyces stelliscabiei]|uniref:hypothetical protein n=1 Tax=Streptomyces stelliscabiei TaxID=146820 RepID=UPI002FF046A7
MSTVTYPHKWWVISSAVLLAAFCGLGAALLLICLHVVVLGVVTGAFTAFIGSGTFFLAIARAAGLVH